MTSPERSYPRLHVFADESGGHTPVAPRFVVAVVTADDQVHEQASEAILRLEQASQRGLNKWKNTSPEKRLVYLDGLPALATLGGPFYYRGHDDRSDGELKTAETVAAAILARDPEDVSQRVITVDALSNSSRQVLAAVLKRRNVQRRDIRREPRDESYPFLRLADSLAGFLRHVALGEEYAVRAWPRVQRLFHKV